MRGSCLCKGVAYEIDQLDTPIGHCSCSVCRKAHAAAFNSSAEVNRKHFRWLRGETLLKGYASSPGKMRYFCSDCGTHLVALEDRCQDTFILRVATLDEDPGVQPQTHIWQDAAAPWLAYGPQVEAYAAGKPGKAG